MTSDSYMAAIEPPAVNDTSNPAEKKRKRKDGEPITLTDEGLPLHAMEQAQANMVAWKHAYQTKQLERRTIQAAYNKAQQEKHAVEIKLKTCTKEHHIAMVQVNAEWENKLEASNERHQITLNAVKTECEKNLEAQEEAHQSALRGVRRECKEALDARDQLHASDVAQTKKTHQHHLANAKTHFAHENLFFFDNFDAQVQKTKELSRAVTDLKLSKTQSELKYNERTEEVLKLRSANRALLAQIDDLQEQLSRTSLTSPAQPQLSVVPSATTDIRDQARYPHPEAPRESTLFKVFSLTLLDAPVTGVVHPSTYGSNNY